MAPTETVADDKAPPPLPDPATFEDRPWFVVVTKPQQEEWARENLERQGYLAWLPLCRELKPMWTASRNRRKAMEEVVGPLFPRYLFCGVGQNKEIKPIESTFGVTDLVRTGLGYAVAMPRSALWDLLARIARDDGVLDLLREIKAAALPKYEVGDRLRVKSDGPFAALEGPCIVDTGSRVTLLLDIMGRAVKVTLSQGQVERAS